MTTKKEKEYAAKKKAGYERKSIARGSTWHWVKKGGKKK